ncbi:hypothetical protein R1flu_028783 [Riccia fluitans]|uniref:Uncharacterized protein n=1 Tax=Riccia fluitans TaxID=41844 RepID=A0ABD1XN83_9MARC
MYSANVSQGMNLYGKLHKALSSLPIIRRTAPPRPAELKEYKAAPLFFWVVAPSFVLNDYSKSDSLCLLGRTL